MSLFHSSLVKLLEMTNTDEKFDSRKHGFGLIAILWFGKVSSSNYFCPDGKLFGFDSATNANTKPLAVIKKTYTHNIEKMKNITNVFLFVFTIISCGCQQPDKQINATINEDKGITEILDNYGGNCEYSSGSETVSELGGSATTNKYFKIEMSKSKVIETLSQKIELPASNIAYLFYKNLNEEKSKYNEIQVVLLMNDGKKMTYKITTEKLEVVKSKMPLVFKAVGLIKDKKFEELRLILNDTSLIKYNKNELIQNVSKFDKTFGTVIEFLPYGFKFYKSESGNDILHISGIIKRDKQNNEFSVDFDPNSNSEEMLVLNYEL